MPWNNNSKIFWREEEVLSLCNANTPHSKVRGKMAVDCTSYPLIYDFHRALNWNIHQELKCPDGREGYNQNNCSVN
jgi:hypothetical protein